MTMKKQSKVFAHSIKSIVGGLTLMGAMAGAAAADFSFTGNLLVGKQVQFFDFALAAPASVAMRTFHYAGGTNAAGTVIPSGGFDPQLFVFDRTTGNFLVANDDFSSFDSGFAALALPAGNYRVALTQFNNDPSGPTLSAGFNGNSSFGDGFGNRTKNWAFDIRNVTSAAVVAPVTQGNLACLNAQIAGLTNVQSTGPAQRNALLGLVNIGAKYLGTVYASLSTTALQQVVTRSNGCGERGVPDTIQQGGNEQDVVTTCPAQDAVLACLRTPAP